VKRTQSRSFSMTCNVGEALLWEGYLLNLSSNCKGQREALPAPRLEQSIEEPPGGCAIETRTKPSLLPLWKPSWPRFPSCVTPSLSPFCSCRGEEGLACLGEHGVE